MKFSSEMMKKTQCLAQSREARIITRDEGKWVGGRRFITSKGNWVVIADRFQHLNLESGQREKEE